MKQQFVNRLSKSSISTIGALDTPRKVQDFIDQKIVYDPNREDRSVEQVLEDGQAECYNGALLATACMLYAGFEASIIRLAARADDEEHVLCVYKENGYFGSIAQSKFLGLKGRLPIYRNIHDLAVSYLEFYFGFDGRYSLYAYSDLFDLASYHLDWLNKTSVVAEIEKKLNCSFHQQLIKIDDPYFYVAPERYWKEILFIPPGVIIPEPYLSTQPSRQRGMI
ncbi:MAG: hypothetical protein ACOZAN_05115 [Patescibacteria group bacterium]